MLSDLLPDHAIAEETPISGHIFYGVKSTMRQWWTSSYGVRGGGGICGGWP